MKQRIALIGVLVIVVTATVFGQSFERVFYSSFSPQDWDIYLSKDSGNKFEKFTDHPALDYDAFISPDGKWVVFTSERSGIPQLYAKSVAGELPPSLLVRSNSFQDQAAFSPDGSQLAFIASHEGNAELYILPFKPDSIQDISSARNLTNHPGGDFRPAFSPDGKYIAFSSDRGHTITPHPRFPFARQRIGDIYVIDVNGENLKRLTDSDSWDGSPIWSSDGTKIIFYSNRNGKSSIFHMNSDGTNQKLMLEFDGPTVSPKLLQNGKLAFTTYKSEMDFKVLEYDSSTGVVKPIYENAPALMFHLDAHPGGLMVFHGGEYNAKHTETGNFGFDGDVLKKTTDSFAIAGQAINGYGVRRAFVAPPREGNTLLYYDAADRRSFFESLKPIGYSVFLLPLVVIVLFMAGIIVGIINRRIIPFWKYLLFSFFALLVGIIVAGTFLFVDVINPMPLHLVRIVMGLMAIGLLAFGWWFYKRRMRFQSNHKPVYRVSTMYSGLFFGLAIFCLLCSVFINQFLDTTIHFYQVDYVSGERKPVFEFDKEPNINPANNQVLDSKVSHDGKAMLFTTGSFRGNASTQGDIWRYDFVKKDITKLSDSPSNDGFADVSEDGKMVFRSGRSGDFDIYLKINDSITNLTNDIHRDNFPAISKQGDKIVFASDRLRKENEYKTMDIFLMKLNADNSWTKPEKISMGVGQNAHPHFSPNGEWVVYTTEGYGINDEQPLIQPIIFSPQMYGEIIAYNISTKERIRLTHNKWEEGTPLWVK